MRGSRGWGGQGVRTPAKNKKIGLLRNTDQDSLKIIKLLSQHKMLGHQRPASETPFKWRFTSGPTMTRLYRYFYHLIPHRWRFLRKCDTYTRIIYMCMLYLVSICFDSISYFYALAKTMAGALRVISVRTSGRPSITQTSQIVLIRIL